MTNKPSSGAKGVPQLTPSICFASFRLSGYLSHYRGGLSNTSSSSNHHNNDDVLRSARALTSNS
jgi:hypothetical protein